MATEVGGYTKGKSTYSETWRWNRATLWLCVERDFLRSEDTRKKEDRKKYCKAKKDLKKIVWQF